jgi:hypothetical protein
MLLVVKKMFSRPQIRFPEPKRKYKHSLYELANRPVPPTELRQNLKFPLPNKKPPKEKKKSPISTGLAIFITTLVTLPVGFFLGYMGAQFKPKK